MICNESISEAMFFHLRDLFDELPLPAVFQEGIRWSPKRESSLTEAEVSLALKNALQMRL